MIVDKKDVSIGEETKICRTIEFNQIECNYLDAWMVRQFELNFLN